MTNQCSECGRSASTTINIEGVERLLCPLCADKALGIHGLGALINSFVPARAAAEMCPYCKRSLLDVKQTGLLGCPLCYEAFEQTISSEFGIEPSEWKKLGVNFK